MHTANYLKKSLVLFSMSIMGIYVSAHDMNLKVNVPDSESYKKVKITMDVPTADGTNVVSLSRDGNSFNGEIPATDDGIYMMQIASGRSKVNLPVCLKGDNVEFNLTAPIMALENDLTDNVNSAFAAYNSFVMSSGFKIMSKAANATEAEAKEILSRYISVADSISAARSLDGAAARYMKLWGLCSAHNAAWALNYIANHNNNPISISAVELFPFSPAEFDNALAAGISTVPKLISANLPGDNHEARLQWLYDNYKTPAIRNAVKEIVMNDFINNFDYVGDYENGKQRLAAMIERYAFNPQYMETFAARRAVLPGADFPDGVKLLDPDGNPVDFSKFLGKYVYVDVWASWCGPCCAEVPYLQELEKQMKDSNVEFVSISIDSEEDSWHNRMEKLKMHGNQLIDSDKAFAAKLNVRSIPHFMLYGPDGKLIEYQMSRPSKPETLEFLKTLK